MPTLRRQPHVSFRSNDDSVHKPSSISATNRWNKPEERSNVQPHIPSSVPVQRAVRFAPNCDGKTPEPKPRTSTSYEPENVSSHRFVPRHRARKSAPPVLNLPASHELLPSYPPMITSPPSRSHYSSPLKHEIQPMSPLTSGNIANRGLVRNSSLRTSPKEVVNVEPFPASPPPSAPTPNWRPACIRSASHRRQPSRSQSSRLLQSLSQINSPPSAAHAPTTLDVELLIKQLAPLPRFNPFAKRPRSESLSAIVGDSKRSKAQEEALKAAEAAKVCRRKSTWSGLRNKYKMEEGRHGTRALAL